MAQRLAPLPRCAATTRPDAISRNRRRDAGEGGVVDQDRAIEFVPAMHDAVTNTGQFTEVIMFGDPVQRFRHHIREVVGMIGLQCHIEHGLAFDQVEGERAVPEVYQCVRDPLRLIAFDAEQADLYGRRPGIERHQQRA